MPNIPRPLIAENHKAILLLYIWFSAQFYIWNKYIPKINNFTTTFYKHGYLRLDQEFQFISFFQKGQYAIRMVRTRRLSL
ncbi:hypothetical protein C0J52_04924 [Blattella germanica]|nr:hypothetical protein C0J52_04924 [Blattella germanica]